MHFAWLNGENNLHSSGARDDAYAEFRRLCNSGIIDDYTPLPEELSAKEQMYQSGSNFSFSRVRKFKNENKPNLEVPYVGGFMRYSENINHVRLLEPTMSPKPQVDFDGLTQFKALRYAIDELKKYNIDSIFYEQGPNTNLDEDVLTDLGFIIDFQDMDEVVWKYDFS